MTTLGKKTIRALRKAMLGHAQHALASGDVQLAKDLAMLAGPEILQEASDEASHDGQEAMQRLVALVAVDFITGADPWW